MGYQETNHTVLVLGWGQDENTKEQYWVVRNHYGNKWGQNGDFLVKRGSNDLALESELSAYDMELVI